MRSLTDPNAVEYVSAASHLNFVIGSPYIGPLYVKVGFPFAVGNLMWNQGMGYTYNWVQQTLQTGTILILSTMTIWVIEQTTRYRQVKWLVLL